MLHTVAPKVIHTKIEPKKYGNKTADKLEKLYESQEKYDEYEVKMNDGTQKDEWKNLDFIYHSRYVIFKDTTVINIQTKHVVTQNIKNGYYIAQVWNDALQKPQNVFIHQLMCFAFIIIPDDGKLYDTVDHIKSDEKLNNSLDNLRWATRHMQNINKNKYHTQSKAILQLDDNKNIIEIYKNSSEAIIELFCKLDPNDNNYIDPNDEMKINKKIHNIDDAVFRNGKTCGFYWQKFEYIDQPGEIWQKDVIFEDCLVTISNYGNKRNKYGMVNKGQLCDGYYVISVKNIKTGKFEKKRVNRIVWSVFSGKEIPANMIVDHIVEGDKSNNKFENLQLLTQKENVKKSRRDYAKKVRGTDKDMGVYKLNFDGTFANKDKDGNTVEYEFDSPIIASEKINSSRTDISRLCNLVDGVFSSNNFLWIYRKDYTKENVEHLVKKI